MWSCRILVLFFGVFYCSSAVKIEIRVDLSDVPYLLFKRNPYSPKLVEIGTTKVFGPFEDVTDQVSFLASGFEGGSGSRELPPMLITLYELNGKWKTMQIKYSNGIEAIISYRKQCPRNFYGTSCNIFCEPQDDDLKGHYNCNENGEPICMEGYTPEQCKESSYPWDKKNYNQMITSKLDIRIIIFLIAFFIGMGMSIAVFWVVFRPNLSKKSPNTENSYSYPLFIQSQNSSGLYTSINYAAMDRRHFPQCSLLNSTNNTTKTWKSRAVDESGTYIYV